MKGGEAETEESLTSAVRHGGCLSPECEVIWPIREPPPVWTSSRGSWTRFSPPPPVLLFSFLFFPLSCTLALGSLLPFFPRVSPLPCVSFSFQTPLKQQEENGRLTALFALFLRSPEEVFFFFSLFSLSWISGVPMAPVGEPLLQREEVLSGSS